MDNYKAVFTYEDDSIRNFFYSNERSALAVIGVIINGQEISREGVVKIKNVDLYDRDKLVKQIKGW